MRTRKNTLIKLAICACMILIAALFGSMIQTAGWTCSIKDLQGESNTGTITLTANDQEEAKNYTVRGSVQSGILIVPKNATKDHPAPGIVLTHGLYNNREMQLQNGIELARRGYVTLLIDREGHGTNEITTRDNYGDSMLAAAKYLYNLTDKNGNKIVDGKKIAVSGHSMGGNATNSALALDGVDTTGRITVKGVSYSWAGATDEALTNGYHMGIISAGLVQANNASNTSYGSNLLGVGIIKASSDEFFFSSTTKNPVYVAINQDKTVMTSVIFAQGVAGTYSGSMQWDEQQQKYVNGGYIYIKKGNQFVQVTEKNKFHQSTQYYAFTTRGNSTNYLISSQAMAFTGQDITTYDGDQYNVVNGGIYNFATGELIASPNGKKLSSVASKGAQVANETTQIRAVYEAKETHPMNHFSTKSAAHVVDFMYAVFGVADGAKFIAPTNQTWLLKEIFAIVGIFGLFGLVLFTADILLHCKTFATLNVDEEQLKMTEPELLKKPRKHVSYWLGGILTAWFGAYSLQHVSEWQQNSIWNKLISDNHSEITGLDYTNLANIDTIAYWGILCGIFALVITALIWFINHIINLIVYKDNAEAYDEHPFAAFKIRSVGNVFKTLLMVGIMFTIFYGCVWTLWKVFVVDFRFWTFDFRVIKSSNVLNYLRYVPFFFIFYMISAAMSRNYRVKDLPEWATIAINVVFNVIGLIILLGVQNSHFIATGGLISSANKLFYIACYPIIPCVIIATIMARRLYVRTGNAWLAGLFNALIFTFMACANTSILGVM